MQLNLAKLPWNRPKQSYHQTIWNRLHLDAGLVVGLVMLMLLGLMILYSASNENLHVIEKQLIRFGLAFLAMFILAQIPPNKYRL